MGYKNQFFLVFIFAVTGCGGGGGMHSSNNQGPVGPTGTSTSFNNASFKTTHFSGSQICAQCHNGISDRNGTDVSVELDWASTMMANSARDPLFRAKLASEISRNPGLKSAIETKCSRCHTPMANVEANASGQAVEVLAPGFFSSTNTLHDAAMDGVSCTLCHQIENNSSLGNSDGFSGNYSIGDNKVIFGPFTGPMTMPMASATGYTPQFSAHISTSELCSTCHNLFTNVVDVNTGQLTNAKFPEQTIYSEWEQSSFSQTGNFKSCQSCHMPATNGVRVSSQGMMMAGLRDNFSRHYFVGGNTFMLDILNRNKEMLGVKANNFDTTIQRTRDILQSSANVQIINASANGGALSFTVKVQNLSGHKLPGGYPARRAYLHVMVKDAAGNVVFESGRLNTDGSIIGVDADENANSYESHHDVISQQDQVQVYESIMADTNNQVTYTLLHGASYLKDNRLLPAGFDKMNSPAEVRPAGLSLSDNNFTAGSDDVSYQLNLNASGTFTVDVELNYQSLAYRYAQDLFADVGKHEYIDNFKSLYDSSQIRKETIAKVTQQIN